MGTAETPTLRYRRRKRWLAIRSGDLIVELDGVPISDVRDMQRLMVEDVIGRSVDGRVWRSGELRTVTVHPVELTAA